MKLRILFFLTCLLFLSCCQPINFVSFHEETPSYPGDIPPGLSIDEEQGEGDFFVSDELDLVLMLDTQPGMDKFYENNIFGEEFLAGFKDYDWKMGYTNTSVDNELLEDDYSAYSRKKEPCSSDDLQYATGMTLFGVLRYLLFPQTIPLSIPMGIYSISSCLSSPSFKETYPKVNGEFLSFELNGEMLGTRLTREDEDYQSIFQHTVTKNTGTSYDAPINQDETSAPLYSLSLSLGRGESFFRKNSQVVYIVVTPVDARQDISAEDMRDKFADLYGEENRLHIIPIIADGSDSFCEMELRGLGVKNPQQGLRLKQIAQDMGMESLSFCSKNLGQELQAQIKPLLTEI